MRPTPLFPTPKWGRRRNAKLPTKQRSAAERHGALRNLTERLNLATPQRNPPYFGGFRPNYVIFFCAERPFPNTQMGKAGECETTDQTKGRRGTPRNVTEPAGAPKFGYSAMESAIFRWISPKLSNILCAKHPPFPNTQMEKAEECATTDQTKGAAERQGTLRNLTERLNLAIPHWNPPYFGGFPTNYVIFFASNTPFSQHPNGEGCEMRNYRTNKGRGG